MVDSYLIVAPDNFSMVESGVYRSAFPNEKNYGFLKTLNIKTVISLVTEEYPSNLMEFYKAHNITLISHGLDGRI